STVPAVSNNYIPTVTDNSKVQASTTASPTVTTPVTDATHQPIHVKTDVFNVDIDPVGGNLTQLQLLKFPEQLHSDTPFVLLTNNPDTRYIAQSGLLGANGPDTTAGGQATYQADQTEYTLS